jgi:DNA-binding response OmpR family regulator
MANRNKKILVVDDDRFMREMLRVVLTRAGYEVSLASTGNEALEMVPALNPDLVLSDGLLPGLHGFMLCKALKEMEAAPKVVLLTAVYTKPTYKWEVKKEYGADDILRKPVKTEELISCLDRHLGTEREPGGDDVGTSSTEKASAAAAFCDEAAASVQPPVADERLMVGTSFSVVPAA